MKTRNIILVTDHALHRAMLDMSLSRMGHVVSSTDNWLEGLNRVLLMMNSAEPFDFVVLDAVIGESNVDVFVQKLRSAGNNVPVLVLVVGGTKKSLSVLSMVHNVRLAETIELGQNINGIISEMVEEAKSVVTAGGSKNE